MKHCNSEIHACRLRMLTPHSQSPEVPQTSVRTNLLQPLQILTQLRVNSIRQNLRVLAIDDVLLPVEEPRRNFELCGILDDSDDTLEFIGVQFTGSA